jgi:hypothetical protein
VRSPKVEYLHRSIKRAEASSALSKARKEWVWLLTVKIGGQLGDLAVALAYSPELEVRA